MNEMTQEILNNAVKNIQQQQEQLIKDRLFSILGYELDIIEESKRRFPRLAIFIENGETSYYWNDGSIGAIRIITFYQEPIDFSNINDNKLTCSLSYK
jgi:hypothetical protein